MFILITERMAHKQKAVKDCTSPDRFLHTPKIRLLAPFEIRPQRPQTVLDMRMTPVKLI